jgi:hypothetical protein
MSTPTPYYCPYMPGNGGSCIPATQVCDPKATNPCGTDATCMSVPTWSGGFMSCVDGYDPQQRVGDCGQGLRSDDEPTGGAPDGVANLCVYNKF